MNLFVPPCGKTKNWYVRVYVPAEDLRHFGVSEDDIAQRRASPAVAALGHYEVARTRALFARARPLIDTVSGDLAVELALMWHGGMRILDKIDATGANLFAQRPALNAIDNSFLEYNTPPSPPLIVSYHTRFSLPGKKMLTYEYQQRLGFCTIKNSVENFDWEIPITEEEIIAARPEKLIIIAPNISHLKEQLIARPAIQQLIHNHGCRLYFLDEEVQKTVSQYYVLAYYDLIHSIY